MPVKEERVEMTNALKVLKFMEGTIQWRIRCFWWITSRTMSLQHFFLPFEVDMDPFGRGESWWSSEDCCWSIEAKKFSLKFFKLLWDSHGFISSEFCSKLDEFVLNFIVFVAESHRNSLRTCSTFSWNSGLKILLFPFGSRASGVKIKFNSIIIVRLNRVSISLDCFDRLIQFRVGTSCTQVPKVQDHKSSEKQRSFKTKRAISRALAQAWPCQESLIAQFTRAVVALSFEHFCWKWSTWRRGYLGESSCLDGFLSCKSLWLKLGIFDQVLWMIFLNDKRMGPIVQGFDLNYPLQSSWIKSSQTLLVWRRRMIKIIESLKSCSLLSLLLD